MKQERFDVNSIPWGMAAKLYQGPAPITEVRRIATHQTRYILPESEARKSLDVWGYLGKPSPGELLAAFPPPIDPFVIEAMATDQYGYHIPIITICSAPFIYILGNGEKLIQHGFMSKFPMAWEKAHKGTEEDFRSMLDPEVEELVKDTTPIFNRDDLETWGVDSETVGTIQAAGVVAGVHSAVLSYLLAQDRTTHVVTSPKKRKVINGKNRMVPETHTVTIDLSAAVIKTDSKGEYEGRRSSPVEHKVRGHFVHYHMDPTCMHVWDKIDARRQVCRGCGARKTWREAFTRGDKIGRGRRKDRIVRNIPTGPTQK